MKTDWNKIKEKYDKWQSDDIRHKSLAEEVEWFKRELESEQPSKEPCGCDWGKCIGHNIEQSPSDGEVKSAGQIIDEMNIVFDDGETLMVTNKDCKRAMESYASQFKIKLPTREEISHCVDRCEEIIKQLQKNPLPSDGEVKSAREILNKHGRIWFDEDEDLDDDRTGYVEYAECLKAMEKYASQYKVKMPTDEQLGEMFENNRYLIKDYVGIINSVIDKEIFIRLVREIQNKTI